MYISIKEPSSSRIFKERVRTQERTGKTVLPVEIDQKVDERRDHVIGSLDTLASLAEVQKDQGFQFIQFPGTNTLFSAESFRAWTNQFYIFKNNVWKFMNETSDVLRKNDKKIKTLQRVVRKIAKDIDE